MRNNEVVTRKEYIEREAAKEKLCGMCRWEGTTNCEECEHPIDDIPAADVVPVVRCADCKWFQINMRQDGYLPKGVPECECRHWCSPCDPTDFCSYGAKMDGDGNG